MLTYTDFIAKASALYNHESHTFKNKTAQKSALDYLNRAYETLRSDDRQVVLDQVNAQGLEGDARWDALEARELPFSLHQYRPAKHDSRWISAERYEVAGQLVSLRQQYKSAGLEPKPTKKAPVKAAGPNAATHMGTCQCCGAQQKLPKGVLSQHGYTVDYGFFNGVCQGAGHAPFEENCDLAKRMLKSVEKQLWDAEQNRGEEPCYTDRQARQEWYKQGHMISEMKAYIKWQADRIALWAPRDLIKLEEA